MSRALNSQRICVRVRLMMRVFVSFAAWGGSHSMAQAHACNVR